MWLYKCYLYRTTINYVSIMVDMNTVLLVKQSLSTAYTSCMCMYTDQVADQIFTDHYFPKCNE